MWTPEVVRAGPCWATHIHGGMRLTSQHEIDSMITQSMTCVRIPSCVRKVPFHGKGSVKLPVSQTHRFCSLSWFAGLHVHHLVSFHTHHLSSHFVTRLRAVPY